MIATLRAWRAAVAYGLGDVGNAVTFGSMLLLLLPYYTESVGLPPAVAATLLVIVRCFEAVIAPFVARIIDRRRFGPDRSRLRIWMAAGALPLLMLDVALFSVPSGPGQAAQTAWAAVSCVLTCTLYALVSIAYGSLAAAATQNPADRIRFAVARTVCSSLTILSIAIGVVPLLSAGGPDAFQHRLDGLMPIAVLVGLLCYGLCIAGVRESVAISRTDVTWAQTFAAWTSNAALRRICCVSLLAMMASASGSASMFYFSRYVLAGGASYQVLVLTGSAAALMGATLLAPCCGRRWGKIRSVQGALILACGLHLGLASLAGGALLAIAVCVGLGAAMTGMAMALLWAAEADTVEYGHWRSGLRLEAGNYAVFALARKAGLAIGGALPAYGLSISGYVANDPTPSDDVRRTIVLAVAVLPALAYAGAAACLRRYPLTDRLHARIVREMGRTRRTG